MSKDNVVNMNEPAYAVDDDKRHDTAGKPFQTKWTEETHMALLCTMMDIVTDNGSISISKHKDQITSGMEGRGFSFTWEAVRQHLQKLRRKEEKAAGGGSANGEGSSTPRTPGGRKKNAAAGVKKEPGSGSKRKPVAVSDEEEDVKPARVKKLKEEPGVKSEESDGTGYV